MINRLDAVIAIAMTCVWATICPAQPSELPPQSNVISSQSYTQAILPPLRNRDPQAATQAFGALIDPSMPLSELIYSDLPSATAALHRALAQQTTADIYTWLAEWTLPTENRKRVRMLTVPVPMEAPPKVFARSIGERPRDETFAVAAVGPLQGVWCSGWMLLQAANDLGQLPQLRVSLKEMVDQRVAGAEPLYVLSQLAGPRGDLALATDYLQQRTNTLTEAAGLTTNDINDLAIAVTGLAFGEVRPHSEALLAVMVKRASDDDAIGLRPLLRVAHAIAVQSHHGQSPPSVLFENRLKHWIPVSIRSAKAIERGERTGVWLTHEHHLLHLAGGAADLLLFRYPLVGAFDFICETQEGGDVGTDGGLVCGGLQFQTLGRTDQLTVWDAGAQHVVTRHAPFARSGTGPVFNHVSIRSTPEASQFESNFHPVWFDQSAALSSPWIGLRSSGTKRPVFRNLRFVGKPEVPRQIEMIATDDGSQLRGWLAFYNESLPLFFDTRTETNQDNVTEQRQPDDWHLSDGQLIGAKQAAAPNASKPGLLQYQRPLLAGDSIIYEFLYKDDASIVHPAVGRLAFLLESGGVRLRWITTGESEWTGLAVDNAALEPLNRRGPKALPLVPNDWNRVRVAYSADTVTIELNGELIYQRAIDQGADTTFGLYRGNRDSESRVRNIIMTGDWPLMLPADIESGFVSDAVYEKRNE